MTIPEIRDLLVKYAAHRGGQFTREEFVYWGAHHGLSRRAPEQVIDGAFAAALAEGSVHQVTELPGAARPTYRRAA